MNVNKNGTNIFIEILVIDLINRELNESDN